MKNVVNPYKKVHKNNNNHHTKSKCSLRNIVVSLLILLSAITFYLHVQGDSIVTANEYLKGQMRLRGVNSNSYKENNDNKSKGFAPKVISKNASKIDSKTYSETNSKTDSKSGLQKKPIMEEKKSEKPIKITIKKPINKEPERTIGIPILDPLEEKPHKRGKVYTTTRTIPAATKETLTTEKTEKDTVVTSVITPDPNTNLNPNSKPNPDPNNTGLEILQDDIYTTDDKGDSNQESSISEESITSTTGVNTLQDDIYTTDDKKDVEDNPSPNPNHNPDLSPKSNTLVVEILQDDIYNHDADDEKSNSSSGSSSSNSSSSSSSSSSGDSSSSSSNNLPNIILQDDIYSHDDVESSANLTNTEVKSNIHSKPIESNDLKSNSDTRTDPKQADPKPAEPTPADSNLGTYGKDEKSPELPVPEHLIPLSTSSSSKFEVEKKVIDANEVKSPELPVPEHLIPVTTLPKSEVNINLDISGNNNYKSLDPIPEHLIPLLPLDNPPILPTLPHSNIPPSITSSITPYKQTSSSSSLSSSTITPSIISPVTSVIPSEPIINETPQFGLPRDDVASLKNAGKLNVGDNPNPNSNAAQAITAPITPISPIITPIVNPIVTAINPTTNTPIIPSVAAAIITETPQVTTPITTRITTPATTPVPTSDPKLLEKGAGKEIEEKIAARIKHDEEVENEMRVRVQQEIKKKELELKRKEEIERREDISNNPNNNKDADSVRTSHECTGEGDPFAGQPIDNFKPPLKSPLKYKIQWSNTVKEMLSRVSGLKVGGEPLRTAIKEEINKLQLLRIELFCGYA
jgi:hypothetical protein